MKSMRFIFALLVVAATTFFIYSCAKDGAEKQADVTSLDLQTETRAPEPCENAIGNCNNQPWVNPPDVTLSIDLYPGCTFEVKYQYRICPNGNLDVMILQYGDWPPCTAFRNDLVNDPTIISKVEKHLMTKLVNELLQDPLVNSLIPLCSSGRATSIGFSTSTCVNFCIIPIGGQITPNGELIKVGYTKSGCGEACCKTTYDVCRDSNGRLNITVGISQGTGNCATQTPNQPCPPNAIGSTGCIPNCYVI